MAIDFDRIRAALQAEAYYAIAADRRFQVVERRHLRNAARTGMLVVILAALVGGAGLGLIHRAAAPLVIGLDTALASVAGACYILLGGRARHYPEVVVFAVTTAIILACVAIGLGAPELAIVAGGYLLLLPPVVSQVVTWRTWTHIIWLLLYVVALLSFIVLAPLDHLDRLEKLDLAVLGLISLAASFIGHVLGIRARIRSFGQLRTIEGLHRTLERTSRMDPLTRVANRLRLDEDFVEVRAQINRTEATCGLLEADLDRFKGVNDRLGHLAGDAVLRSVAQALQAALRAGDHVYRYGGEEFVMIISGADGVATEAAAERLRRAIEVLAIPHPDNEPADVVTVTIGATVIGPADIDETDEALFDRADRAMYAAKKSGRNRVATAWPKWLTSGASLVAAPPMVALDATA